MHTKLPFKKYFNHFKNYEILFYSAAYIVAAIVFTKSFFDNVYATLVITALGFPIFLHRMLRYLSNRQKAKIEKEFYAALRQISISMASGATLENAVKEMVATTQKKSYQTIKYELETVYRMLRNHYAPDQAFRSFAARCKNQEIQAFAEVLAAGIPAGINLAQLIKYMSAAFQLKADVELDIRKTLNAPKYNNRIIMAMPFLCVVVFRKIAPAYMAPLMKGSGRIVLAVVFLLIVLAWWFGERLSDIQY